MKRLITTTFFLVGLTNLISIEFASASTFTEQEILAMCDKYPQDGKIGPLPKGALKENVCKSLLENHVTPEPGSCPKTLQGSLCLITEFDFGLADLSISVAGTTGVNNEDNILDQRSEPNIGLFENVINLYDFSFTINDSEPMTTEFFTGDIRAELITDSQTVEYTFASDNDVLLSLKLMNPAPDLDLFLAVNDFQYILEENLFTQSQVIDIPVVTAQIVDEVIETTPEPNNIISLLVFGGLGLKALWKKNK